MSTETNGHIDSRSTDNAKAVAKASGQFTTDQIRILRALKSVGRRTLNRQELKIGCGMKAETLYSANWLNGLWDLHAKKFVMIEAHEPSAGERTKHVHAITVAGRDALSVAEKALKDVEKVKKTEKPKDSEKAPEKSKEKKPRARKAKVKKVPANG